MEGRKRQYEESVTSASPAASAGEAPESTSVSSSSSATVAPVILRTTPSSGGESSTRTGGSVAAETQDLTKHIVSVKARYNHFENSMVFVHLAMKLMSKPTTTPPSIFRAEHGDPDIYPLSLFAERLATAFRCKYPCYVLALIYLQRIIDRRGIELCRSLFQRTVVGAMVVAAKFFDDLYFSNEHYAKELGFKLELVNSIEAKLLILLDFNLTVPPNQFQPVMATFDQARVHICAKEQLPVLSGLQTAQVPSEILNCFPHDEVATVLVTAAATGICSPSLEKAVHRYLVSRESKGFRYEAEEEHLSKLAIHSRCKIRHKLISQWFSKN